MARFESLELHRQGTGYRLMYTARWRRSDGSTYEVAFVEGASFGVVSGEPYELKLTVPPGSATGGVPFDVQPQVAVVDRGGNVIEGVTGPYGGTVVASLASPAALRNATGHGAASGGRAAFLPSAVVLRGTRVDGEQEVALVDGVAVFDGLFINEVPGTRVSCWAC